MSEFLEYETEEELLEEQDSGVWLSVGDLMSGLLMFFALLFIAVSAQLQEKITQINQKEQELLEKEEVLQKTIDKAKQLEEQLIKYKKVIDELPSKIVNALQNKRSNGQMEVDPKTGDVKLGEQILFDEGSTQLKPEGKEFLKSFIPVYSDAIFSDQLIEEKVIRIIIEGHTSSKGSEELNMELSLKRALAVNDYIFSLNFNDKDKFKQKILPAGRGEIEANQEKDTGEDRKVIFKFQLKKEDFTDLL